MPKPKPSFPVDALANHVREAFADLNLFRIHNDEKDMKSAVYALLTHHENVMKSPRHAKDAAFELDRNVKAALRSVGHHKTSVAGKPVIYLHGLALLEPGDFMEQCNAFDARLKKLKETLVAAGIRTHINVTSFPMNHEVDALQNALGEKHRQTIMSRIESVNSDHAGIHSVVFRLELPVEHPDTINTFSKSLRQIIEAARLEVVHQDVGYNRSVAPRHPRRIQLGAFKPEHRFGFWRLVGGASPGPHPPVPARPGFAYRSPGSRRSRGASA